jgi:hypothetical protein
VGWKASYLLANCQTMIGIPINIKNFYGFRFHNVIYFEFINVIQIFLLFLILQNFKNSTFFHKDIDDAK